MPGGLPGVHLFSGELHRTEVDLRIPGRGLDFVWARHYRSQLGPDTAQGIGWDYSYNIRVELAPDGVIVHDGNTRADLYTEQLGGTYTAKQLLREGSFDVPTGQVFTLTFADTGFWEFRPLNAGVAPGRIDRIVDRNGNQLSFAYTGSQLTGVTDTLGRTISIAYVAAGPNAGRIQSVTDFAGRQVLYDYYEDTDPGGSAGDLASARSPVVTGTSTGNDFPTGKTTVYTYSKGYAHPRLDHNLLTVTDPKGQTFVTNVYAAAKQPTALSFDRLVRQTLGTQGPAGDHIDISYAMLGPQPQKGGAALRAIVNDRVGNVSHHFFDRRNRCVAVERYTGRADADLPTTATENRPTDPLRIDDPPKFVTRWEWNADSRPTRVVHPNGNETVMVYELELAPAAPWRERANLRELHRLPGTHTPVGDQTELVETFTYEPGFGNCCSTAFVKQHVDARGNQTVHTYDADGNRLQTQHRIPSIVEDFAYNAFGQLTQRTSPENDSGHRRVDTFTYYTSGPQLGYRQTATQDDGGVPFVDDVGFHLQTTYEYDSVGNLVREIDPEGNDTQIEVNALNQVVRETSPEVALPGGGTTRYERDTYRDANDNVVRVDVQHLDEHGVAPGGNTHYTTIYEYEILNRLVRECTESGDHQTPIPGPVDQPTCAGLPDSEFVTTEYAYDANRNRTLVRYGEAVENRQDDNAEATEYDERDLLFRKTSGAGGTEESTSQQDYDGNGNVRARRTGIESGARVTTAVYDAYDRRTETTDPMGNVTSFHYDANGNIGGDADEGVQANPYGARVEGELIDVPGSAANVRLSEKTFVYDAMDREIEEIDAFFDPVTQLDIDDGESTALTAYTDSSHVLSRTDDRGNTSTYTYDTANRLLTFTNAEGNVLVHGYDDNSNRTSLLETDKSASGAPDQSFTTLFTYDGLDRMTSVRDPGTHVTGHLYDSRGNRTSETDARSNETRHIYDGLDRRVCTEHDLWVGGAGGAGPPDDGMISTTQAWDDSTRLAERADHNSNGTVHEYDGHGRLAKIDYADCTEDTFTYNAHHEVTSFTDGNLTTVTSTYDLLGRLTGRTIAPGPGVSADTTFETYTYDGLSRIVLATDDDSVVVRRYDSLSRLTLETLNGQTTTRVYDGVGNEVSCTYPGGRTIEATYDQINQHDVVSEPAATVPTIVDFDFVGRRLEGCSFPVEILPSVFDTILMEYTYDNDRRVTSTRHRLQTAGLVHDHRGYTWDDEHNKTLRQDLLNGSYTVSHEYDSVDRVERATTVEFWTGNPKVIDATLDLDEAHNWGTVTDGSCGAGSHTLDATPCAPGDWHMNQYTSTPCDDRLYDDRGNLIEIDDGSTIQTLTWDYKNQLITFDDSTANVTATYAYDAFGRRISKTVDDGSPVTTLFFYRDWQVIEEQDGSNVTEATYVYGPYVDHPVTMERDVDLVGGPERYHYLWDDNYNVVGLSTAGLPVELYEHRSHGEPLIIDLSVPTFVSESAYGNPYLFTGRRYDAESGLHHYRHRNYDSRVGRFISRDPLGVWGDGAHHGNAFGYAGSSPWSAVDPFGNLTQETINLYMVFDASGNPSVSTTQNSTGQNNQVDSDEGPIVWVFNLGQNQTRPSGDKFTIDNVTFTWTDSSYVGVRAYPSFFVSTGTGFDGHTAYGSAGRLDEDGDGVPDDVHGTWKIEFDTSASVPMVQNGREVHVRGGTDPTTNRDTVLKYTVFFEDSTHPGLSWDPTLTIKPR